MNSNWDAILGWLLGLEKTVSIEDVHPTYFTEDWARENPFWVFLGITAIIVASLSFYLKYQNRGSQGVRLTLAAFRAALLVLLFVTLANPMLTVNSTNIRKPLLYVLFDGTDSMGIADDLTDEQRDELFAATGYKPAEGSEANAIPTRQQLVQALVSKEEDNIYSSIRSIEISPSSPNYHSINYCGNKQLTGYKVRNPEIQQVTGKQSSFGGEIWTPEFDEYTFCR